MLRFQHIFLPRKRPSSRSLPTSALETQARCGKASSKRPRICFNKGLGMSARRFYLPPEQCKESTLFLAGREAHHAMHVIRVRKGDAVTVLDGAGQEIRCLVEGYDRDKV